MPRYCFVLALPFVACQSASDFRTPPELVELYDMGSPDGMLELELERDGSIIEMEVDLAVDDLPEIVQAAARKHFPSAEFTGAEREIQEGHAAWEVKFTQDGRAGEVVVDDAGQILETERELRIGEAPVAVIAGSEGAIPDSAFKSVELIRSAETDTYHVKRTKGGASYKVVLDAQGNVLRKVREARAEIEIPLQ